MAAEPDAKKLSAAEKRKQRRKTAKANKQAFREQQAAKLKEQGLQGQEKRREQDDVELEYVSAPIHLDDEENPVYTEFQGVLEKFMKAEELLAPETEDAAEAMEMDPATAKAPEKDASDSDSDSSDGEGGTEDKLSKKKRKLLSRLKIAELKQSCRRPDVVEVWDVTAQDPRLLVFLKGYRNTVPVPRHWSQKRKFLQGKRGIEKPIFQLPDFIEATGISEMRQSYQVLALSSGRTMHPGAASEFAMSMGQWS